MRACACVYACMHVRMRSSVRNALLATSGDYGLSLGHGCIFRVVTQLAARPPTKVGQWNSALKGLLLVGIAPLESIICTPAGELNQP